MPDEDAPEWLTEAELAKFLGVSRSTVGRLRREGTGPPAVMVGQRARYLREAVMRWIAEGGSVQRGRGQ
jgi:excisionase family DNA binding protein